MSRIAVIGGHGFYGARVVAALQSAGHQVLPASRSSTSTRVDLSDPSTFEALASCDAVVNASDSVLAPPDLLASWCLDNGLPLFEMGADLPGTERLLQISPNARQGHLIVGVGVFPGLSTALGTAAYQAEAESDTVELSVRMSPLSGAGTGTIELMTASLTTPSVCWRDGRRHEGPPIGAQSTQPFLRTGSAPAVLIALPDAPLLARSTSARNVRTSMSPNPSWLRFNFRLLVQMLAWAGPLKPLLEKATTAMMRVVRGVLLRERHSALELSAVAGDTRMMLAFDDGQEATGLGTAAAVLTWLQRQPPSPGVYGAAEVLPLDEWLENYRALGGQVQRG